MQARVYVAEKHATTQGALSVSKLHSGRESLFGTGDAAANQDQESTRVDRSAPEQRDGRSLDHEVARHDASGNGPELQQCDRSVSLFVPHLEPQTIRK